MHGVMVDSVLSLGMRVVKYPSNGRYVQRFIESVGELGGGVFSHKEMEGSSTGWVVDVLKSGLSAACESLRGSPPVVAGVSFTHLMYSYACLGIDSSDDLMLSLLQRMLTRLGVSMGVAEIKSITSRFVSMGCGSLAQRLDYLSSVLLLIFESFFKRATRMVKVA